MSFSLDKAIALLDEAKRNHRLAHAYLITGSEGSGKEALALHLVSQGDPAAAESAGGSVDGLKSSTTTVIGPVSKSRRITVKAIRGAEHTLRMAAPGGVTKFAVIREADRMGEEAENAFLKTLEEPPEGSRLLLLTEAPEMLLDTIRSRCVTIALHGEGGPAEVPDAARDLLRALGELGGGEGGGISAALGLMSRFSGILRKEKSAIAKRNEAAYKEEVATYRQTTEGDYLKQREKYYEALTEAEYLRQRNRLVEFLMMWFGDALRQQNGSERLDLPDCAEATARLAERRGTEDLLRRIEAVEELRGHLNTNANEGLVLEAGFVRAFG